MNHYHIYHSFGPRKFTETDVQSRVYVGFVEANSMEEAFEKSQNSETPWNPQYPCRSTSVGDVIQDEIGEFYMILSVGFRHLESSMHDKRSYQIFL